MNNTPVPVVPTAPDPTSQEQTTLKDSFFKSLRLAVDTPETPPTSGAPVPDSGEGVEVSSGIDDFSDGRGSLADMVSSFKKNPPPAAPATTIPPAPASTPPPAVTPPPAAVVPPPPSTTPPPPANPPTEPAAVVPDTKPPIPTIKLQPLPSHPDVEPTVAPVDVSRLDLTGLDEDEVNEVQTAAFAEQRYPEKYKGHTNKVLAFIKQHKQIYDSVRAENPDGEFDENNPKYRAFLKSNKPNITDPERRRLERERLLAEASSAAEERVSKKYRKVEEELTHLKAAPVVEKTVNDYKSLLKQIMPQEDDPLVEETTGEFTTMAVDAGKEFLLLSSKLRDYDSRNNTHRWLADFIQDQGDMYTKSGHSSLKRGNKVFVPRAKYNSLPPDERSKHWTFSDEDVLQLIAVNARAAAEHKVKLERERLQKAGYVRQATPARVPPPVTPTPVEPDRSPKAGVTVSTSAPITTASPSDPFLKFMTR